VTVKPANKETLNNFLYSFFGFQKSKSTSGLVLVIFIHIAVWCLFLGFPFLFYPVRFSNKAFFYRELITKIFPIIFFYANYYFFLPKYFEKKKFGLYALVVLASIIIVLVTDVFIRRHHLGGPPAFGYGVRNFTTGDSGRVFIREGFFVSPDSVGRFLNRGQQPPFRDSIPGPPAMATAGRPDIFFSLNRTISSCLFFLLLGGIIRLAYSFLKNQNEKRMLENANLNAEVNFLKSQINPHFLFNTLNGIYSQAHNKSENTEYSILKLSELLRYVLYESGGEKVALEKDIQYINNYIDLQRLRISSKVTINYTVQGSQQGFSIAPLLLISFIENSFKHGISYSQASTINIEIEIFEKTLTLKVSNPVVKNDTFTTGGGLGLKNVKRRLELLYYGKYSLDIHHTDNLYFVYLKLDLKSD